MALYGHSHQSFPPEFGAGPTVVFGGSSHVSNSTPPPQGKDDLQAELTAMQAIGTALGHLTDRDTRARVLRWATDRFCLDRRPTTPQPSAAPATRPGEAAASPEFAASAPSVVINVASADLVTPSAESVATIRTPPTEPPTGASRPATRPATGIEPPPARTSTPSYVSAPKAPAAEPPTSRPFAGGRPAMERISPVTRPAPPEDPLEVPTLAALEAMETADRLDSVVEDPLAVPSKAAIEALTSSDTTMEDQLSVENLEEFFGQQRYPRPVMRLATGRAPAVAAPPPPPAMSERVESSFSQEEAAPAQTGAEAPKPGEAAPAQSVTEMLHELAADFQKMVDEWHSSSRDP